MPSPKELYSAESSVLITGASSGIGAALAQHIAGYGARIALIARREDRLVQVAEKVRDAGGTPLLIPADVASEDEVRAAHDRVVAEHGPIDVAYLNAGMTDFIPLHRFEAARYRRLFEVNVFGVVNWIDPLLPEMISRGRGIIAVTSSLAAARGLPGSTGYAATKAAASMLLDGLRCEAAPYGIQLTVIEPGFVKSEMSDKLEFPLPFLMETPDAARLIANGVAEGKNRLRFPWPIAAAMQVVRHLPDGLYDRLGGKMMVKLREKQS